MRRQMSYHRSSTLHLCGTATLSARNLALLPMARCGSCCAVLVAVLAVLGYSTLSTAGALRTLRYHDDVDCTLLVGTYAYCVVS